MQEAFPDDYLLEKFIELMRELGRFPVHGEVRLKSRRDADFPNHGTFARLGSKQLLAERIVAYCETRAGYDDIIALCRPHAAPRRSPSDEDSNKSEIVGFVYLLRSGRHYKIGKTNAVGRCERELAIQLPEKVQTVHVIRTDDPGGIEAYWHRRFEANRRNGEWFELTPTEVKAFKRRRFM